MPLKTIKVVVGVIRNNKDQILLTRRSEDKYMGGLWEFPGGKQKSGETSKQALMREIKEELGMTVSHCQPLVRVQYEYPEKKVCIDAWEIDNWTGVPVPIENQPLDWVNIDTLSDIEFPAANAKIIRAINLPRLYLICPLSLDISDNFYINLENCVKAGARLIQLRSDEDKLRDYPEIVRQVLSICKANNARLLLNSDPVLAIKLGCDGVHLNSCRLLQMNERPLDQSYCISAACHNQTEINHAVQLGMDIVIISPIKHTQSHPAALPIGWEKFSDLAGQIDIPAYALGGMKPQHLSEAWEYGARGIAMMGGVWTSNNPHEVVRQCNDWMI